MIQRKYLLIPLVLMSFALHSQEAETHKQTLLSALEAGDLAEAQKLIDARDTDINALEQGKTALTWAAAQGNEDAIKMLLSAKADVNAVDLDGNSPLMLAAKYGYPDVVQTLINAGANVNYSNSLEALKESISQDPNVLIKAVVLNSADVKSTGWQGNTALIYAAEYGEDEIVQILLKHKAEIDKNDNNGSTALMWAAYKGRNDVVETLIKAGADVNKADARGNNALILAAYKGHNDVCANTHCCKGSIG